MTHRFSQAGFTLIELLAVVAIAAIFTSIATFSFNGFNQKTNSEAQIRKMASDLNQMRMRALATKQRQGVTISELSYKFLTYSSVSDSAGTAITDGLRTVGISQLSALPSTKFTGTTYQIDPQGMLIGTNSQTVYLLGSANIGSVNCLVLSAARTSVGKQNTLGGCDAQ